MDFKSTQDVQEFAERVRFYRLNQGLSQDELAQQVGISRVYLSQIERGQATNLSWKIIDKLAEFLGIALLSKNHNLPQSLLDFQKEYQIADADVEMLSTLQFRGKKPQSVDQWHMLYNIIKASSETWK